MNRFGHPWRAVPFLVLLLAVPACAETTRMPRTPTSPDVPQLTVMTYNVNYGLAGDPETLDAITDGGADVVFLQETTPRWEHEIRRALAAEFEYAHVAFHHSGGAGGLAILSKFPFEDMDRVDSPIDWFPAWRVVVHAPLGEVQVLNVHLRPPVSDGGSWVSGLVTTPPIRHEEITHFAKSLDPELPTLVVGDFNEGKRGRAIRYLHDEKGMRSVLPEYLPRAKTWRWKYGVINLTKTLDHIVYGPGLEPLDAQVVRAGRSDHLPVFATFVASE